MALPLISHGHAYLPPLRLHSQEPDRTRRVLRWFDVRRGSAAPHIEGLSRHTSRYRPWRTLVVIECDDEEPALQFERYLKTGSGREFARRHFRQTVGCSTRGGLITPPPNRAFAERVRMLALLQVNERV